MPVKTIFQLYQWSVLLVEKLEYNHTRGDVYLIQHYVIKFVSDLRQVGCFIRVLRFPPPIKLTAGI